MLPKLTLEPLPGHRLRLTFSDGTEGAHLAGRGVFRQWEEDGSHFPNWLCLNLSHNLSKKA